MACSTGNTIYYNIRELPEIFAIENGNLILVETETGTNILDYENFIIDLDHTTFGETITQNTTNISELSSKSPQWDNTYTTVATYSAAWDAIASRTLYDTTLPSYAYKAVKATKIFTGNWVANNPLSTPQYLTGLSAALSCAYTDSFVRVDVGVTTANTPGATGHQPGFTLLSAALDSNDWGEMISYVKSGGLGPTIPGIWTPDADTFGEASGTRHTATSLLFKPGLSAVKVQVGYRFDIAKTFQINGAVLGQTFTDSSDANGISFISLQEVPDNGFVTIEIEE